MAVLTFQHGVGGYEGTQDTVIFSQDRNTNFGTEGHISADQQDFNNVRQGLLKFEQHLRQRPGQIPLGRRSIPQIWIALHSGRLELRDADEPVSHAHGLGRVRRDLE